MIVAAGCSFTSSDFKSYAYPDYDVSYKKWPEILSEHFNCHLVNFARCGYGNDYILDKVIPFILENHSQIDFVVIGWTEMLRFNLYHQHHFNPTHWLEGKDGDEYSDGYSFLNTPYSVAQKIMKETDLHKVANKLYEEYNTLILLCKHLNVKFIFGQMLRVLDYDRINFILPHNDIDVNNFLSHPIYDKSIYELMCKDLDRYTIGKFDRHPNEEGHKFIADLYLKKCEKLYGI